MGQVRTRPLLCSLQLPGLFIEWLVDLNLNEVQKGKNLCPDINNKRFKAQTRQKGMFVRFFPHPARNFLALSCSRMNGVDNASLWYEPLWKRADEFYAKLWKVPEALRVCEREGERASRILSIKLDITKFLPHWSFPGLCPLFVCQLGRNFPNDQAWKKNYNNDDWSCSCINWEINLNSQHAQLITNEREKSPRPALKSKLLEGKNLGMVSGLGPVREVESNWWLHCLP